MIFFLGGGGGLLERSWVWSGEQLCSTYEVELQTNCNAFYNGGSHINNILLLITIHVQINITCKLK